MTSQALEFQGVAFNAKATTGTEVTNVSEITGINGPNGQAAVIDVTHSLSVAKEKRMGLQDWGQISLNANMLGNDPGHDLMLSRKEARSLDPYEIQFNDANTTVWTFSAYTLSYAINGNVDAKLAVTINLEVSGDVARSSG